MKTRLPTNLSFDHACALIVLALIALRPLLTPLAPHDFWWHLRQGEIIAQSGAIPTHDAFSWTQNGRAFFDQSWLSQLLLHALNRVGGLELIVLFQAAIVTLSYALLLWLCARRARQILCPARMNRTNDKARTPACDCALWFWRA